MNIGDLCNIVKREGRYGSTAVTNDQATLDILNSINVRRKRIWQKWDWYWVLDAIQFNVASGTTQYAVQTVSGNAIGKIYILTLADNSVSPANVSLLKQITLEKYYEWEINEDSKLPGLPDRYVNIGLGANGLFNVIISPSPSAAYTIQGYGKKILTTNVLADIIANTALDFFPDAICENVLLDGVLADIAMIQGDMPSYAGLNSAFEAKLKALVQEEAEALQDHGEWTDGPPDYYIYAQRHRRSGTNVV